MRGSYYHHRFMSTNIGEGVDKVGYLSDAAEAITDVSTEVIASEALVLSEVAIAAADSAFPVAALQYVIDSVHYFTRLGLRR
ncbi:mitochondrial inner membrane protein OXA1-like [Silene latifolia]|uniref:mitochondrial inner membrane protein OXA1-like n=1 Tax=Silene latifolia TaxID=37657 RepID=UPI003D772A72